MRFSDQEKINEFGRLNNRLLEVSAELKQSKEDNEKLDDAFAELIMAGSDGKIMLLIGEAFIETNEDEANECKIMFTAGDYILEQPGDCSREYHILTGA